MGDFRIVIEAAGGHGCNRTAKEGEEARGCGSETCPDCLTARFVSELQRAGMRPNVATFTHWPAVMAKHEVIGEACIRCGAKPDYSVTEGEWHKAQPCNGASYSPDREVVDDLTEKSIKFPAGGFMRVTPRRLKGHF